MPRFRVSRAAQADIRSIGRYSQDQWGAPQRRQYLTGLNEMFEILSDNPDLAAERREFEPPVRIQQYQKHLIFYVAENADILVVRVLHQRMDVPAQKI